MEGVSRNKEGCRQLLDLIHSDRAWLMKGGEGRLGVAEEKKLELRLGPPGEDWFKQDSSSLPSSMTQNDNKTNTTWFSTPWGSSPSVYQQQPTSSYLEFPSKTCCTKGVGEKKACSHPCADVPANPGVHNSSQKRSAPAPVPVVGWPPVRSFRKNLASSSSSKQVVESHKEVNKKQESCNKGMFVKINMDGVPIGRKIDLKAYDSYEKLSTAVDELFRDLLAAQRDSPVTGNLNNEITGLLDGSGEYTLVYEDTDGDRLLVGDVPWDMFASTVKRLRVLKSSELSALRVGRGKHGKTQL